MAETGAMRPVRGTQLLVEHISGVFRRPLLLAVEVGWRWLFGIPFLWICRQQARQILAAHPLESSGLDSLDTQNPWVAAIQIANGFAFYQPHVLAVLRWLLPAAAVIWIVLSGMGRALLLRRMEAQTRFRPMAIMAINGGWLALFALVVWAWLLSMQWLAATHIRAAGEPDLVGYFIGAIVLSLGLFTVFALASWPFSIASVVASLGDRSVLSAFAESLRLGGPFTSKLVEINLVLGIVKLALIVLAMVFSAAPLPFGDELGSATLHLVSAASLVFYVVANDLFQIVRLKAFLEFWKVFRGSALT
jgi:hypothetical protein